MRRMILRLAVLALLPSSLLAVEASSFGAPQTATVRLADGFQSPVGTDGAKRFYVARGYRANGHLGEDWNGEGGGDTDLGDPVFCTAHGVVVFAQDYRMGWGNVIIVRHAYLENGRVNYADSLYGHLNEILTRVGDRVSRGQKIGTIGNNHGQYDAHLHFELRKNISVGMFRNSYPRDLSVYWVPSDFIAAHATLTTGGQYVAVPVNTFPTQPPPVLPGLRENAPLVTFGRATTYSPAPASGSSSQRRAQTFTIDRYGDIRESQLR